MTCVRAFNETRRTPLAAQVVVAASWWRRLRGLIARPPLREGEGLLLAPCRAVHTYWMAYPIDVVFLAANGEVLAVYDSLPPGAKSRWHRRAVRALELPAGRLRTAGTAVGDEISFEPIGAADRASQPRTTGVES